MRSTLARDGLFPGALIGSDGIGPVPELSVHARVLLFIGAALPCVLARLIDELINRRALRWPFACNARGRRALEQDYLRCARSES